MYSPQVRALLRSTWTQEFRASAASSSRMEAGTDGTQSCGDIWKRTSAMSVVAAVTTPMVSWNRSRGRWRRVLIPKAVTKIFYATLNEQAHAPTWMTIVCDSRIVTQQRQLDTAAVVARCYLSTLRKALLAERWTTKLRSHSLKPPLSREQQYGQAREDSAEN